MMKTQHLEQSDFWNQFKFWLSLKKKKVKALNIHSDHLDINFVVRVNTEKGTRSLFFLSCQAFPADRWKDTQN